jgi:hypothetical protein
MSRPIKIILVLAGGARRKDQNPNTPATGGNQDGAIFILDDAGRR